MDLEPEEYGLALRARDGDAEALSELVERTRLRLFALAYAELRHYEDAQDAVAAALLRICRNVQKVQDPKRIGPWMHSIVRNEARRMRSHRFERPLADYSQQVAHPDDTAMSRLKIDIERALAR